MQHAEKANAQIGTFGFFRHTSQRSKNQKSHFFCQRTDGQIDNYSNIIYLEKRDIEK